MTDTREAQSAIFARKVRELRKEHGWSQAQLGRQLGKHGHKLGQSRVAAIEETGSVTIDQAAAFAAAFGVPIEALLYERPPATQAMQVQRLMQISQIVFGSANEVNRKIQEMLPDMRDAFQGGKVMITPDGVVPVPPYPAQGE